MAESSIRCQNGDLGFEWLSCSGRAGGEDKLLILNEK